MTPLTDQVAVVTGAGSGIGRALALALSAQGAGLVLIGRRSGPREEVAGEVRAVGGQARACSTDLTQEGVIRNLAAALAQDFGRVDILVHGAAVVGMGAVAEASAEDFDLHYRTNVLGPYLLTQSLLPLLRARRGQV